MRRAASRLLSPLRLYLLVTSMDVLTTSCYYRSKAVIEQILFSSLTSPGNFETVPLDIHGCVEGLSDRGNSGIVEQNLLLHEGSGVWYFLHNHDVGVLPTSFFEDGSREHFL